MSRFVVWGEALIDLVPAPGVPDTFSSPWQAQTAGGPLNTAIALARLGRTVEFCGPLSTDAFGRQMRSHLLAAGVGAELAPTVAAPTALAVVSLDRAGKASYHFHTTDTATFDLTAESLPVLTTDDWLHVASLALVVRPGADTARAWATAQPTRLSIDVNVRPAMLSDPAEYWRRLEPWVQLLGERGGLLKGSDEDFDFLAAGAGLASGRELVAQLVDTSGVGCGVVTRGPDGAEAFTRTTGWVDAPGRTREVVDTVGAGDTFTAGFLDVYADAPAVDEAGLTVALQRGIAASALVVSRRGAQPPTATEVDRLLAE
ncbi:PfkB family carbohydrate kinase [Propionibacteriaceae bacterium Y2011]|uniref:PfkB family carbohydrate kinase n=1 Tax=Microlunatus sp. Y2014 TaxID=3418488 RepID=UPI003B4448D4